MKRLAFAVVIVALAASALIGHHSRPAHAAPQDMKLVSVICAANPEMTTIQNTGMLPMSLNGFAVNGLTAANAPGASASTAAFAPLPPFLALQPGQQAAFYSGPAAPGGASNPYTLTRTYLYNHLLARTGTEGAILSYNGQAVSVLLCAETPAPTPSSTSVTQPVRATAAPTNTPAAQPARATAAPTNAPATQPARSSTTPTHTTPAPTRHPAASPATIPSTALPVTYDAGWNLAAGTAGTRFSAASAIEALPTDGSAPHAVDPSQGAVPGQAYWVYVAPDAPSDQMLLEPAPAQSATVSIQAGVWSYVGNPTLQPVLVIGADEVAGFDPTRGYFQEGAIPPGFGAAIFSQTGSQVTLVPAPAGQNPGS